MKHTRREKVVRIVSIVSGIVSLTLLLSACGADNSIPMYKVSESTGLYSTFGDINAEQLMVLPEGTILVPVGDESKLFCDSFTEAGMPYVLCEVKVLETGQTGWVLKLYIKKN